jgi:hypothetical protein
VRVHHRGPAQDLTHRTPRVIQTKNCNVNQRHLTTHDCGAHVGVSMSREHPNRSPRGGGGGRAVNDMLCDRRRARPSERPHQAIAFFAFFATHPHGKRSANSQGRRRGTGLPRWHLHLYRARPHVDEAMPVPAGDCTSLWRPHEPYAPVARDVALVRCAAAGAHHSTRRTGRTHWQLAVARVSSEQVRMVCTGGSAPVALATT